MKKFLALIIVLGLPLLVTPATADKHALSMDELIRQDEAEKKKKKEADHPILQNLSCSRMIYFADHHAGQIKIARESIMGKKMWLSGDQHRKGQIELHKLLSSLPNVQALTQWATIYQAFCKP